MRRKLWLLLILSLLLVGRESCCASSAPAQEQNQEQDIGQSQGQNIGQNVHIDKTALVLGTTIALVLFLGLFILDSIIYWYFDLHQKEEGWFVNFFMLVDIERKCFTIGFTLIFICLFQK